LVFDRLVMGWGLMMKRCAVLCLCALLWASWAQAQNSGPNLRQSIVYFLNFRSEAQKELDQIKLLLERESKEARHPYTEQYLLYTDLGARIEQAMALSLDLCDLYFIYSRATYCFAKEEKNYLLSRIDEISASLERLLDKPFVELKDVAPEDAAKMQGQRDAFLNRVRQLRAVVAASLPAIKR